jgi:organic radical activating enzyme
MQCKFLQHGLAISYDNITKPCCSFKYDPNNSASAYDTDLATYHASDYVQSLSTQLENGIWPTECNSCKVKEQLGKSSMREMGNRAYENYDATDITLEIRPGNVCNFACQTCWPAASSRVTSFFQQAGFDVTTPDRPKFGIDGTANIVDYEFLDSIKDRIKDVVILGGEPFYDKSCLAFLDWAIENLSANLTLFTNTSIIREDIISAYPGTLTIVSSLDAVGKPAEYIRFGTEWDVIEKNFNQLKTFKNVKNRVNITSSAYNFYYISDVIEFLLEDWPEVVSFGTCGEEKFKESVIPLHMREDIITRLQSVIPKIARADIVLDQKQNAVKNIGSIIKNLQENPYNEEQHLVLKQFSKKLDTVKRINSAEYGDYLKELLNDYEPTTL